MSEEKNITAISEKKGVQQKEIVGQESVQKIQKFRKTQPTVEALYQGILNQNIVDLSRAITLIESNNPQHNISANELILRCLPHANQSIRIGITGVPGVGKSTFIEAFGNYLTSIKKKVAVLAVDPSSSISFGSILGDKTRMETLVTNPNAYIRPSAAGFTLGGVAKKTRESIILCEAAGFDIILIETVGVGQSETLVHSMVDFFLLLKISGAGDELQGIKRGIMEMADAIIINKADGDNIKKASQAKMEFSRALHLFSNKKSGWSPTVSTCSAITGEGISQSWDTITNYLKLTQSNHYFEEKRNEQNENWMLNTINESLKTDFYSNPKIIELLKITTAAVKNNETSPFAAAKFLLKNYKNLTR